ncbi:DNA cytosine methyltransferase [Eubacterium barkeri]|uniref:Cytosine-specific methyltransferase n=1 Tax=Eubacterium barkeri TaxID=1528 RepID=A0A1H3JTL0_EUBBA|nr:DNA cytosine methyltransferase [Eubacterium barkeri]SDY43256.1 DNA (cytosine-5)-methyltransferase 1 [Eubacterium barkeri]
MLCIDLFAGAGGLSEGFRRLEDFEILAHVEMDKAAATTLLTREAYYYLKEKDQLCTYYDYLLGNINREAFYAMIPEKVKTRVINQEIGDTTRLGIYQQIDALRGNHPIDVILGGPPCQAYSLVGRARDKNGMKDDPRNYLFRQYFSFVKKYQPKVIVFENVSGLSSAKNGEIITEIKKELKAIGYRFEYRLLNSADYGVPQKRKRIILIGWSEAMEYGHYPEFESLYSGVKPTIRRLFEDLPELKAGGCCPAAFHDCNNPLLKDLHINDGFPYLTWHVTRGHNSRDLDIYKRCVVLKMEKDEQLSYKDLPKELKTHQKENIFLDRFKVVPYDDVCHTVVAHISKDGHYYIHPSLEQNRSISVREAARIQTFPDDFYFEKSRTDAFKQIGNAVPPLMAEVIARGIKSLFFGDDTDGCSYKKAEKL